MLSQVAGLLGGGALVTASNALVVVIATLDLEPSERGRMVVAATIAALVSLLATCGIGPAVRALRPALAPSEWRPLNQSYALLTILTGVLGGALSATACVGMAVVVEGLGRPPLIWSTALSGAALVIMAQLTEVWYSGGRFSAGSNWAGVSASVGLVAVLVVRPATAASVLAVQHAGIGLVLLLQWRYLLRADLLGTPQFHLPTVNCLLRRGLPTLGFSAGSTFVLRMDRLLLGSVAAPAAVAVYALAATVSEAARLVPIAIGQIALHRSAQGATHAELRKLGRLGMASVAVAALVIVPVSYLLIVPVFGHAYGDAPPLIVILLGAEVFFSLYIITSLGLMGRGGHTTAGTIGLIGTVVSIPAYLVGAHLAGPIGCAVASVIVYALLMALAKARLQGRTWKF